MAKSYAQIQGVIIQFEGKVKYWHDDRQLMCTWIYNYTFTGGFYICQEAIAKPYAQIIQGVIIASVVS